MNTDKSSTHQHTVRGVASTSTGVHSHALTATDAAIASITARITKLEAAMADVILSITKLTGPTVPPGPNPPPPPVQPPVPPPIEPTPGTGTPPGVGTSVPVSIDATGATDVTTALTAWLQGLPVGATALLNGGTFKVSQIHLRNRGALTVEGAGATIINATRSNTQILLIDQGGNDQLWRNLTIKGLNPNPGLWAVAYEGNHAVGLGGAVRIEFSNVTFKNVGGDGIYAGARGGDYRWADSISVHNCTFDGIGRMGIALTDGCSNFNVHHNTFKNIGYYTFDIEANGYTWNGIPAGAAHVKFNDNVLGPIPYGRYPTLGDQAYGYIFCITGSSGGGPADDCEVLRNTMVDPSWGALKIGVFDNGGTRTNIRVIGNTGIQSFAGPVMEFEGVNGLTVTGNTQPLASGSLVSTTDCTSAVTSPNP